MFFDAPHAFTMSMKPSANQSHVGSNEASHEKVQKLQHQHFDILIMRER
jgi:hypothetical protein